MTTIPSLLKMTEKLLTLESTAQATEHFKPDMQHILSEVNPIKSEYQRSKQRDSNRATQLNKRKYLSDKCKGCGRNRHPKGRDQCHALGQKCNNCRKLNHFSSACFSSKTNSIQEASLEEKPADESSFLSSVTSSPL